jgi:hypothetical protein
MRHAVLRTEEVECQECSKVADRIYNIKNIICLYTSAGIARDTQIYSLLATI